MLAATLPLADRLAPLAAPLAVGTEEWEGITQAARLNPDGNGRSVSASAQLEDNHPFLSVRAVLDPEASLSLWHITTAKTSAPGAGVPNGEPGAGRTEADLLLSGAILDDPFGFGSTGQKTAAAPADLTVPPPVKETAPTADGGVGPGSTRSAEPPPPAGVPPGPRSRSGWVFAPPSMGGVASPLGGGGGDRPPTALSDSYSLHHGSSLTVAANSGTLANDSDPDGDPLTAVLETRPSSGTLTLDSDGSFIYTPGETFTGVDSFTYRASDGSLTSAPTTVSLTVVNELPVAGNDIYSVLSTGITTVSPANGVLANDNDVDDGLAAMLVSGPSNGMFTLNPDGSFTYTPGAGFTGSVTFTYYPEQ